MYKRLLAILGIVVLAVLALLMPSCTQQNVSIVTQPSNSTTTPINADWTAPSPVQQPVLPDIVEVVTKVKPSVVAINVEITSYDMFNQPFTQEGAGSGWIIDKDGYIVTDSHVVEGANSISVTMDDGSTFSVEEVRTDPLTDIAVISINAHNLPAAEIGDSTTTEVGDWVVAIGNSLGLGTSATSGIVSALVSSLIISPGQALNNLIQTDAAINPGNSGGPLVNMAGEVIGINSIKISQVGVEGMGYAYSINEVMPIVEQLIRVGYVVRPWLGVAVYTVDQMVAGFYNLAVDKGVLLTEVVKNGPADKAGLQAGDVITDIEGKEIGSVGELTQTINSYEIGQTIEITFWRESNKQTTHATLTESPPA